MTPGENPAIIVGEGKHNEISDTMSVKYLHYIHTTPLRDIT